MTTIILSENDLQDTIASLAEKIKTNHADTLKNCVLVGILPAGLPIAERISHILHKTTGVSLPVGKVDTSLYHENLLEKAPYLTLQETDIPFSLKNKILILINDIFYDGKDIRAALNTLIEFDSPKKIELGVLLDRGFRTLPIHPDYVVHHIKTKESDVVETKLFEIDGEDCICLATNTEAVLNTKSSIRLSFLDA